MHAIKTDPIPRIVARAPVLIFMLIASVDGKADKKALKALGKLLASDEFKALLLPLHEAGFRSFGQAMQELTEDGRDLRSRLEELDAAIDLTIPLIGGELKFLLLNLGVAIAKSSGGRFGGPGSPTGDSEKGALTLIAETFGLPKSVAGGAAANDPGAIAGEAMLTSVPDVSFRPTCADPST